MLTTWRLLLLSLLSLLEAHAATSSSVALTSTPNPSTYGRALSITATVTPAEATGSVTFYDGEIVLGIAPLASGSATFSTAALAAGSRRLRARYNGDTNFGPSTFATRTHNVQAVAANLLAGKQYSPGLPSYAVSFEVADFNGDKKADLLWAGVGAGFGILLGNGDGTFQPSRGISSAYGVPSNHSVAVADLNGDGRPDIALLKQNPHIVEVLLGYGDGTFWRGPSLNLSTWPTGIASGDFNRDGIADLVVLDHQQLTLYLGLGDASFRPPVRLSTGTSFGQVAVGDFNGDGSADLVVTASGVGGIKVLLGTGDGAFPRSVQFDAEQAQTALVADFDTDGLDDIAIGIGASIKILKGTSDGNLRVGGLNSVPGYVNGLLAKGDVDGDGKVDLITKVQNGPLVVLSGNGDGSFGPYYHSQYLGAEFSGAVVEGEFNGDGRTDILLTEQSVPYFTIFYGVLGSMSAAVPSQSAPLGTAFQNPLKTTITDSAGNPVTGVNVAYSVPPSGAGAVLSSATAVTNASGEASVTATANNTAGSYSVSATAGRLLLRFDLTNLTDVATTLTVLSGNSQSAAAGMPYSVPLKVALKNRLGQPVSGATVSFSQGAGVLLSNATATTNSSGEALVWAAASNLPGTFLVTASSGGLSANLSLTVLAAVPVSLTTSANPSRFGQPVTLTATVPSGVTGTVTFYDGTQIVGTAVFAGQTASRSTILLQPGTRTITARYSGDATYPASRSNPVVHTVAPVPNTSFSFGSSIPIGETYQNGRYPVDGVVADFNGDGKADIAVANAVSQDAGSVSVLLGNGDGTFGSGIRYSFSGDASAVAAGDFNGDGNTDLVVGSRNATYVLLGRGDGTMSAAGTVPIAYPFALQITDLNRDGRADILALTSSNHTLSVLTGNGNGTFQPPVLYDTQGEFPGTMVVADFNLDGGPDIAIKQGSSTGRVSVFLSNPDGTLLPVRQVFSGGSLDDLQTGDFDADGKPDLLVVGSQSWTILMGVGDGTFRLASTEYYPTWTTQAATADFDGDGKTDIALTYGNSGEEGVLLLLNMGSVAFRRVAFAGSSSYRIIGVGAFNGTGAANIALLDYVNRSVQLLREPPVSVGISSTHDPQIWQGLISVRQYLTVTNNQPTPYTGGVAVTGVLPASLTATGITGPGWNCDVTVLTCTRSDTLAPGASFPPITVTFNVAADAPAQVTLAASVAQSGTVLASTSDLATIRGGLNPTETTLAVSPSPANIGQNVTLTARVPRADLGRVAFYDGTTFLGSSLIDVVSWSATLTTNALPAGARSLRAYFRGNGLDAPSTSPTVALTVRAGSAQTFAPLGGYTVKGTAWSIAAGDFNSDGKADLAIATDNGITTLLGSGAGTFQQPVDYSANRSPRFIAAGDLNGDGRTDLVTANPSGNDVTAFLANADGSFQTGISYPAGSGPVSLARGDVDGDGVVDLVIANSTSGALTILLGKGDGSFMPFATHTVGGEPVSVAIGDFNGDKRVDIVVATRAGSLMMLLSKGNGGFQAPVNLLTRAALVAVIAADLNGDGKTDLATASGSGGGQSNNVSVLLGNGNGTFGAATSYPGGLNPAALAAGDWNGDGSIDLAVANGSGGGATTLLGNGDGTFRAPTLYAAGESATSLAIADFNGDAKLDIAVTTGIAALVATRDSGAGKSTLRQAAAAGNNVLIFQGASCPTSGALPPGPVAIPNGCTVNWTYTAAAGEQIALRGSGRGQAYGPRDFATASYLALTVAAPAGAVLASANAADQPAFPYATVPASGVLTFPAAGTYTITASATGGADGSSTLEYIRSGDLCTTSVVQLGVYGMTPFTNMQLALAAEQYKIGIAVPPGCPAATVSTTAQWITVGATSFPPGYSTATVDVSGNYGNARTGALSVGGTTYTFSQPAGNCNFRLSSSSAAVTNGRTAGTVQLTADSAACNWTASSDSSWAQVYPLSGPGTDTIRYTVFPNFSTKPRTAIITVAGQTFTIVQPPGAGTSAERFVKLLYFNFFGRIPSDAEVAFQANSGQSRAQLASNFYHSAEFNDGGRYAAGMYVGILNRDAEYGGWLFQRDALSSGTTTPASAAANFVNSQEFALRNGTLDNAAFVRLMYRQVLLREATQAEVNFQVSALVAGLLRPDLARNFLISREFTMGAGPRLTAFLAYAALIQRQATEAEMTSAGNVARQAQTAPNLPSGQAIIRDNLLGPIVNSAEFNKILE